MIPDILSILKLKYISFHFSYYHSKHIRKIRYKSPSDFPVGDCGNLMSVRVLHTS